MSALPNPARYEVTDKTWILRTLREWRYDKPRPTSAQLARQLGTPPEHMRRQLEQLERDGYVKSSQIGRQRSRRWRGLTS